MNANKSRFRNRLRFPNWLYFLIKAPFQQAPAYCNADWETIRETCICQGWAN
jgi:hypothetical protein